MPPTLSTARLLLTPVEDDDLARLHAHWNDPRVARFLWDAIPVPTSTVADLIARSQQTFRSNGWGLWAVRPARRPALIGVCGLSPFDHGPRGRPGSRSARAPTPASPSPDPGMLLEGPCSSMDRATDF
jgi:[ribosomal protein S5]-alanine N-acetyltransferase